MLTPCSLTAHHLEGFLARDLRFVLLAILLFVMVLAVWSILHLLTIEQYGLQRALWHVALPVNCEIYHQCLPVGLRDSLATENGLD